MSKALVEITGFKDLEQKLKALANDKQKKTEILRILRKVAQATVKAARRNAPKSKKAHLISGKRTRKVIQPGNLAKSVGTITGRKGGARINPTVYVGPRAKGKHDGFYGNWVEYGHKVKGGGKSRALPFMKTTYSQTKGQVTKESEQQVAKYIQKRINALSK